MKKKYIKPVMALVLVGAMTVGGTLAYLSDQTGTVTNTFTAGTGIDITLFETKWTGSELDYTADPVKDNTYALTSGAEFGKDPVVTVADTSASCYLFVDVTEFYPSAYDVDTYDIDDFLHYDVNAYDDGTSAATATAGWKEVTGTDSVTKNGNATYLVDNDITTATTTTTYVWVGTDGNPLAMSAGAKAYILADYDNSVGVSVDATNANGSIAINEDIDGTLNALAENSGHVKLSFVAYAVEVGSVLPANAEAAFLASFDPVTETTED